MSFLNPFLLLGLLAITIPLVIHLINLKRPKKIRFSTLAFFESLQESTLRRIRVKKILLLSLRVLAVAMLALALAQPFLTAGSENPHNRSEPGITGILVDNSPSMGQVDQNGPYIDQVKRLLDEIIEHSDRDERFYIEVTNGEALNLPAFSPSAAKNRISELSVVNSGNYTVARMNRLSDRLEQSPQPNRRLILISDGQETQFEGLQDELFSERGHSLGIVTVGSQQQPNVAVTGVRLQEALISRDQPATVVATVRNFGSAPVENYYLSLERPSFVRGAQAERPSFVRGAQAERYETIEGEYSVSLGPGETKDYPFDIISAGGNSVTGVVTLGGDELTFDNRQYFSVRLPDRRHILVIQNEQDGGNFSSYLDPMLNAATASSELLSVERRTWGDNLLVGGVVPDAVILDGVESLPAYALEQLLTFLQEGGGILFLPSENGDLNAYNRFLEQTNTGRFTGVSGSYGSFQSVGRVSELREGHPVLNDIFEKTDEEDLRVNLPELFYHYDLSVSSSRGVYAILQSTGGARILIEQQFGSGRVMVSAIGTDPGWSNFPVKPFFAPLYYRAILYLAAGDEGGLSQHQLGTEFIHEVSGSPDEIFLMYKGQEIVPDRQIIVQGTRIRYDSPGWSPGFLNVHTAESEETIALNQHAMESDFGTLTSQELEQLFHDRFGSVSAMEISGDEVEAAEHMLATALGRDLWYWFVLLAALLLIAETLAGRIYKAESIN